MKRLMIAVGIALVGFGPGCGHSASPTFVAPSGSISAPAEQATPLAPLTLNGFVSDTAFRPMAGVRLEIVNGPDAGKELISDDRGGFSSTGMFSASVTIRATKEGYIAATSFVIPNLSMRTAWVFFQLAPVAPSVDAAGNYTLTMTVDSACAGFPDEVRTRSYAARVAQNTYVISANTRFDGTVTGAQFAPFGNFFFVGVAGDYITISTEGEGPTIVEQVGPKSYIAYSGSAGASVQNAGATLIAAPFAGVIEYCELKSAIGQYYDCSDDLAAVKTQCTSPNSRLSLTRR